MRRKEGRMDGKDEIWVGRKERWMEEKTEEKGEKGGLVRKIGEDTNEEKTRRKGRGERNRKTKRRRKTKVEKKEVVWWWWRWRRRWRFW